MALKKVVLHTYRQMVQSQRVGQDKNFFGVVSYQVPNWMLRSYGSVIDRGWTNGDLGRESKSAPRICARGAQ